MENVVRITSLPVREEVRELVTDRRSIEMGRVKITLEDGIHVLNIKGLKDGDVFEFKGKYWRLVQREEKVIRIVLREPTESFRVGFAVGNLHMKAMVLGNELYIPLENPNLPNLLSQFKPEVTEKKFIPNVEIPIEGEVVQFVDPDH
ncbi:MULTISPECIES: urease accessory protein UreE [Metallosphaera]|uniref:Uncharacterized protein n=4 Tax=Metallosphaera TaxID=41980 RepID=A4YF56_METS5|nr:MULTISPECIES: hypothetical protein [Metallosphaera]ABP95058.1 hypothetical protein Msed_0886 [Metallosphaera sedula DSM 5348]AIM27044.1 hypothetical protein HA72_0886 [Metallosphaera sedula]MCH1771983.1 hypothetical protein [Metallosphaera sedula]MCP6728494.1 hypothetical protein [Metallosphaera sedula]MCY0861496.1 hypothetical protein [Metallosphaera prunae]